PTTSWCWRRAALSSRAPRSADRQSSRVYPRYGRSADVGYSVREFSMSRLQSGELAKGVDLVYAAALRRELWPFALTQESEILRSDSIGLFAYPNGAAEWAVWPERSFELIDWFVRGGWHLNNPRPQRAIRVLGQMRAGTESDLFTPWELEHIAFNASMRHELGYLWDAGVIAGEING